MNYLPRNRSRHPFLKPALFLCGIFLLGAAILPLLDGPVLALTSPLWRGENAVLAKFSWAADFFRTRNSLIGENNNLKAKIAALEIEIAARFSGTENREEVMALLGRRAERGGVLATALVAPPETPYDTLIIDAGSNDGVKEGSPVLMPEGPMLGVVSEAYARSAKVRLFSSPGERTAAILERHGVSVTLEGAGGGNFRVVVSRETEVEVGDRILSADVSSQLLGVVGEVDMAPTDSFKEVRALGPVNVFNIHFVLVRP
jgi:rod shape-determining protein MreC